MTLWAEIACFNFTFLGVVECHHSMDCCFDSSLTKATHVSTPVTKKTALQWLSNQAAAFYDDGIQNLLVRYDECLSVDGNHVEK
jgi:hypothetical protein